MVAKNPFKKDEAKETEFLKGKEKEIEAEEKEIEAAKSTEPQDVVKEEKPKVDKYAHMSAGLRASEKARLLEQAGGNESSIEKNSPYWEL